MDGFLTRWARGATAVAIRVLPGVVLGAVLAGCGSGGGGGGATPPPPAADTTPPSVPQGVTATAVAATRIDLAWTASTDTGGSGLAGYRVFRDGGANPIATVNAPTTTYSDTSVQAATSYAYTVRAFDAASPANVSADSASATATTPAPPPPSSGLDARPVNATCVAPARPSAGTGIAFARVFPNLSFASPVGLHQAPGDTSRWFVIEQGGTIRAFANSANVSTSTSVLNISARLTSGGERGLLGLAFHPQWPTVPHAFVYYTSTATGNQLIVSRFRSTDGGTTLDSTTEERLLTLTKNQPDSNHNGGNIAFGPDGFLYVGTGDGGSGGDPNNNAQNLNVLFGKMLRIDVGTTTGYSIPATNRWVANARCGSTGSGTAPCAEIFAYGLRNPWKWSFDRGTGQLWVGDVGQNAVEEVDVLTNGGNFGWRLREGAQCFNPSSGCGTTGANGDPLVGPVVEYAHDAGNSITGGYVYRGTAISDYVGRYVFADFGSSRVFAFTPGSAFRRLGTADSIATAPDAVAAFAQDAAGELYIVGYSGGIYALRPASGGTDTIATQLSATGCVDPTDAKRPYAGLIPYAPNAPFWSDGADKLRWIGLPANATIAPQASGDWDFPNGTVLMKSFRLNGRLIETRLFMRHPDGVWAGYTYEWNDAETDATRVTSGRTKTIGTQTWTYPSESQCVQCHTQVAGRSLGLETAQLNGSFAYPQTGRTANQLATLNAIGVLAPQLTGTQPAYPDPFGTSGTVAERARAYLHTNCSQCHQPGGPTPVTLDLRYSTPLAQTNACNVAPTAGNLGIANALLIAPGDAARSVLVARTNRRDANAMPPLASTVVDTAGVQLLQQWIGGLSGCQ